MAANVLNSPDAIQMSVFVVRAFIKMREALISRSELERRLLQIENVLLAHDESIRELYDQIRPLLLPPPDPTRERRSDLKQRKPKRLMAKVQGRVDDSFPPPSEFCLPPGSGDVLDLLTFSI